MSDNTAASKTTSDKITVRFGDVLLQEGHTAVPNLVMNHYAKLGISPTEMLFIIHVWQFWWTEKNAYPALPTIAKRMDMSDRQIQNYVKSLKDLRYHEEPDLRILAIHERYEKGRGQTTNEFDFSGLLRAISLLHGGNLLTLLNPRKTKIKTGVKDSSPGTGVKDSAPPPVKYSSPEEDKEQEDEVGLTLSNIRKRTRSNYKENGQTPSDPNNSAITASNPIRNEAGKATAVPRNGMESVGEGLQHRLAVITAERTANDQAVKNRKGKSKPATLTDEEYESLILTIKDYSRKNGDMDHVGSNTTHACNIITETRCSYGTFYSACIEAYRKVSTKSKVENRMAYWFSCLEAELGIRPRYSNPSLPN